MKAKEYLLLRECVERGVVRGWNRAHKYVDAPEPENIRDNIEECVLAEICEYFTFDDEVSDDT